MSLKFPGLPHWPPKDDPSLKTLRESAYRPQNARLLLDMVRAPFQEPPFEMPLTDVGLIATQFNADIATNLYAAYCEQAGATYEVLPEHVIRRVSERMVAVLQDDPDLPSDPWLHLTFLADLCAGLMVDIAEEDRPQPARPATLQRLGVFPLTVPSGEGPIQ